MFKKTSNINFSKPTQATTATVSWIPSQPQLWVRSSYIQKKVFIIVFLEYQFTKYKIN